MDVGRAKGRSGLGGKGPPSRFLRLSLLTSQVIVGSRRLVEWAAAVGGTSEGCVRRRLETLLQSAEHPGLVMLLMLADYGCLSL